MTNLKQRNKITAIFLSILMLFSVVATTLGTTGMSSSAAETTILNMVDWYGLSHKSGTLANGTTMHSTDYFDIFGISGGKPAYCLEPGVQVAGGTSYTQVYDYIDNHIENNITNADIKQQLIAQIIQYAPEKAYGDVDDYCRYAAAQILIWEVLLEERDAQFNYVGPASGDAIMSLMRGEYLSQVKSDYNEIAAAMIKRGLIPSFSRFLPSLAPTIKLNQYDGTYFYGTVTDTNNVVGNFSFEANGFTFSVSGNKLTIKTTKMITDPVMASGTYTADDANRRGLFFWNRSGYQAICSLGDLTDPAPSAYFKVKTDIFGQIIVNKTSSNTSVTNGNNYYSFKGAQYRITGPNGYNKVITTNADGVAKTENTLYLGEYTITEIKAPPGYTIDPTPQTVTISQDSPIVSSVFTEHAKQPNQPQMGKIQIQKSTTPDEECNICNKVVGNNLNNMKGGIFNIINSKGAVVDTVTTDETGFAESKALPLGKYSIEEVTPPPGYIINEDIADVELTSGDQTVSTVYKASSVFEEHQHGRIRIIKNDAETGANPQGKATLYNATFQILDPDDNMRVLQTLTCPADANYIESDLLPLGKTYVIVEKTAPVGYQLTTKRYEVRLDYDQTNVPVVEASVTVFNEVIRGTVEIVKSKEEIVDDTKVTKPFEGVEFILTSKTTGQKYAGLPPDIPKISK